MGRLDQNNSPLCLPNRSRCGLGLQMVLGSCRSIQEYLLLWIWWLQQLFSNFVKPTASSHVRHCKLDCQETCIVGTVWKKTISLYYIIFPVSSCYAKFGGAINNFTRLLLWNPSWEIPQQKSCWEIINYFIHNCFSNFN